MKEYVMDSPYQLQLRKFDISEITDNKTIVLIGKRGTGMSWLMRDIIYHPRMVLRDNLSTGVLFLLLICHNFA